MYCTGQMHKSHGEILHDLLTSQGRVHDTLCTMEREPRTAPTLDISAIPAAQTRPTLSSPRFLLFLAATVAFFLSIFLLQAAVPQYLLNRGYSNGVIGLVVGILSVSAILPRPLLGAAMDRGTLLPLLLIGAILMLTSPLYALAALPVLVAVRLVQGVASAIFVTGGPVMVSDLTPPARRGEAIGLFNVASTVAIAIGPQAGLFLGGQVSYTLTFALSAVAALLCIVLLLPLRSTPPTVHAADAVRGSLLEWRVLPAAVPGFAVSLAIGMIFAFIVTLMDGRGMAGAGFYYTLDAVGFFFIRAIGGRWSDRYGRWRVVIPGVVGMGAALGILVLFPNYVAFAIAGLIWGGSIALTLPELNALAVDLVPPARRGAALATFTGISELGIAIAGVAFGWVADAVSLPAVFLIASVLLFGAAAWSFVRYGRQPTH